MSVRLVIGNVGPGYAKNAMCRHGKVGAEMCDAFVLNYARVYAGELLGSRSLVSTLNTISILIAKMKTGN